MFIVKIEDYNINHITDQDAIWKCTHCEFTVKPEIVLKICKMIQDEIDNLEAIEEFDVKIQEAERLLKKYKSVLHPHNVYMTSLRHSLVQWYGRAPGFTFEDLPDIMLERKIEMCRQVLQVVDVVKPGMNRFRGKHQLEYTIYIKFLFY